jgi:hypothetical protein
VYDCSPTATATATDTDVDSLDCVFTVPLCKNFVRMTLCDSSRPQLDIFVLIDSGSDVCVADESVLVKYNISKNECFDSDRTSLTAANNGRMNVDKMICINVNVGGYVCKVKFYVVQNLHTDFILGWDWLTEHRADVSFHAKRLCIKGRKVLYAAHTVSVPPQSEQVVIARIRGDALPRGVTGIACGGKGSTTVMVGKTLDAVSDNNCVRVRCMNVTNQPLIIKRNHTLGQFRFLNTDDCISALETNQRAELPCQLVNRPTDKFRPSEKVRIDDSNLAPEEKRTLCQLIDDYADVFVGPDGKLGRCGIIQHQIELTDHTPVRRRPYRLNPKQQAIMEEKINELLQLGVIEESVSPWSAPCLLVAKQGGKDYRVVTDLRGLNAKTVPVANPLPTIVESLENIGLQKPKFFSVFDLHSGFFQAELHPASRPYTAFSVPNMGLFQYTTLPQGMRNSPQTFQRLLQAVLRGLCWRTCALYIDDIIVYHGQTFHEHVSAIEDVLKRLRSANLKLKAEKCHLAKRSIKYLGHIVDSQGISTDPDKVSAVKNYPRPKSAKDVKAFLGLVQFYRKFIKDCSKIAAPLHAVSKPSGEFIWSADCDNAFQQLKQTLVTAPVLKYPDMNKPFRLYCDASRIAFGAVLAQLGADNKEYVVAYAGRSLKPAEKNLGITDLEGQGLVYAVQYFDFYIRNVHCDIYVDHLPLLKLMRDTTLTGKYFRWVDILQGYDHTLIYKKGVTHSNADALSRREYEPVTVDATEPVLAVIESSELFDDTGASAEEAEEAQEPDLLPDMDEVARQQRVDVSYKDIIDYLESDVLPDDEVRARQILWESPMFTLCDGVLYRVHVKDGKGPRAQRTVLQLAIPQPLVKGVLINCHDSPVSGGHFGIARTIGKVKEKYYFPKMGAVITKHIQECVECTQRKHPSRAVKASITPMPVPEGPWVRVSTDILGKLPTCRGSGNKYVLVFIDYFTKFVELVAIPDAKAETVARALIRRVILRHGAPQYLHSDRGTNYLSKVVKATCKMFKITKTQTTSFHPACNGQSERMMSNILNSLSKMLNDKHDVWDNYLPYAQYSYNTTPCLDSTGYAPYFLEHGRYARMPMDTILCQSLEGAKTVNQFIERTVTELQFAYAAAEEVLKERKEAMRAKSEQKAYNPDFRVGDVVYIYDPVILSGNSPKLSRLWAGPYYIVEKPSPIHAVLRRVSDNKRVRNKVHVNRLKRGCLKSGLQDFSPPPDADACEPIVLDTNELSICVGDVKSDVSVTDDVVTDSQVSSDVNETVLVDDASVNVDSTVNDSSKTVQNRQTSRLPNPLILAKCTKLREFYVRNILVMNGIIE